MEFLELASCGSSLKRGCPDFYRDGGFLLKLNEDRLAGFIALNSLCYSAFLF